MNIKRVSSPHLQIYQTKYKLAEALALSESILNNLTPIYLDPHETLPITFSISIKKIKGI